MIIVVDLDDTLLASDGKVSAFNKTMLQKAKEKGHKIVVSTLRSFPRCKDIANEIEADLIGCFLGNLCVNTNGKVLKANTVPIKNFESVIEQFSKVYDGWIGFETDEISVIANKEVAAKYDGVTFVERENVLKMLKNGKVFKLSFECKDDENIVSKFKEIAENLGVDFKFSRGNRYIDLFPKNTDKVNTIKFLRENYVSEKIIVFGDDKSDKQSIELADIGVCMANGLEEVKMVADIVADTNDNSGVGKVLENLI